MPAIPGLASLAGSPLGSVRVPRGTPTGLGEAERAGARGDSEIQNAGCARRCFRCEIVGQGFDSPHLQEGSQLRALLEVPIAPHDFLSPLKRVLHPDPAWLRSHPEFQIFRAIVILDSVLVVNGLVWIEMTA